MFMPLSLCGRRITSHSSPVCDTAGDDPEDIPEGVPLRAEGIPKRRCQFESVAAQPHLTRRDVHVARLLLNSVNNRDCVLFHRLTAIP